MVTGRAAPSLNRVETLIDCQIEYEITKDTILSDNTIIIIKNYSKLNLYSHNHKYKFTVISDLTIFLRSYATEQESVK